jgi:hypothetical protein
MKLQIPEIPAADRTPLVEALLALLDVAQQHISQVEETVRQLRDEIAILKGQKPRPQIAPSVLETPARGSRPPEQIRPGSDKRSKNAQLVIHDEQWLGVNDAPPGSVHKSYEPFVVQDLHLIPWTTRYWRQRILIPEGRTVLAPLPSGVVPGRHFGVGLIAYVLNQHHHNGVTQPLLLQDLHDMGIDISSGQIHSLLTEDVDAFHEEKDVMLPAALAVSSYIGVDDTGARHQGHNGYCTAIGNALFAFFQSSDSKSRVNFLEMMRGTSTAYVINATAQAYWKEQELSDTCIAKLSGGPSSFADEAAWQAWLTQVGLAAERLVRIATEGALLGCLIQQGVSPELVVLSDGAGQFNVLVHAACWVHAERPLKRLIPYNEAHRLLIERVQMILWELYKDLKTYAKWPDPGSKRVLESRFDELVGEKTGYPSIDGVLKDMREHKADLLRILEYPEVPLHNNGMESDIREYVKKRKISGGTRSDPGRRCRDTFTSLKKTCRKLGVSFWSYLRDRLGKLGQIPPMAELIRQRALEKSAGKVPAVLA